MAEIAGLILAFAVIASLDLPSVYRQKDKQKRSKNLMVYGSVLGLAFVLSMLQTLRVPLLSPNRVIEQVFHFITP